MRRRPIPSRPGITALRLPAVATLGILIGGVTIGTALAEPAGEPADQTAARQAAISIVDHADLAPGLAEVRLDGGGADPAHGIGRLLGISPDGRGAAVAGQIGPDATLLTIAGPDGERQVQLPGLISAAYAPNGSWLAAIDGAGGLWRVAADGATQLEVAGPFAGEPLVEPDGSILALRVSSVEAPIESRLVRVPADGSSPVSLSGERLVYGVQRLADSSLVYAAHRPSGTVVLRAAGGREAVLADLGDDVVHASVSAAGDMVAFERSGQVFVRGAGQATARSIGAGSKPRIAADGRSVLVELPVGVALLALDGRQLARFGQQAAFATCSGECEQ